MMHDKDVFSQILEGRKGSMNLGTSTLGTTMVVNLL
jgi:hypothetical protein